jgi:UDP-glucuronate decarboxylase
LTPLVPLGRVLVAGGAGFLGSHLCERLLEEGSHVLCIDNYSTGCEANIALLRSNPGFEARHHDIKLPFDADVDAIFNVACPASPVHYQLNPVETTMTSVLGALNLLDLAARRSIPILQASTSKVYGDPTQHPQTESYNGNVNPIGPRACYDVGKRCVETLFFDHHRQLGVRIEVARIFNTSGPRMRPDDGRVVSNFIVRALRNEPIELYGDGSQTRAFCYVDDMVKGLISLMRSDAGVTGPMNLGNPEEIAIRRLAELVIAATGSNSKLLYMPLPADDPKQRCPDIALARAVLGWAPKTKLRAGLEYTVAFFRGGFADADDKAGLDRLSQPELIGQRRPLGQRGGKGEL